MRIPRDLSVSKGKIAADVDKIPSRAAGSADVEISSFAPTSL
jgi:hypothetical protein